MLTRVAAFRFTPAVLRDVWAELTYRYGVCGALRGAFIGLLCTVYGRSHELLT